MNVKTIDKQYYTRCVFKQLTFVVKHIKIKFVRPV